MFFNALAINEDNTVLHKDFKMIYIFLNHNVHPSNANSGILKENLVDTMSADDMVTCVTRSSAAMLLTLCK